MRGTGYFRFLVTMVGLPLVFLPLLLPANDSRESLARSGPEVLTVLELKSKLGQLHEPLTLVHVWATWCEPCREEFPSLLRIREEFAKRGVALILISADPPAKKENVSRYLEEQGASFPSYIIDNPNDVFINALSTNWSGAIPVSFILGPKGELRQWWEGKASHEKYRETLESLMKEIKKQGG